MTNDSLIEKLRAVAEGGYLPDGTAIDGAVGLWLERIIRQHEASQPICHVDNNGNVTLNGIHVHATFAEDSARLKEMAAAGQSSAKCTCRDARRTLERNCPVHDATGLPLDILDTVDPSYGDDGSDPATHQPVIIGGPGTISVGGGSIFGTEATGQPVDLSVLKAQEMALAALHHLQADGSLDRGMLADTIRAMWKHLKLPERESVTPEAIQEVLRDRFHTHGLNGLNIANDLLYLYDIRRRG